MLFINPEAVEGVAPPSFSWEAAAAAASVEDAEDVVGVDKSGCCCCGVKSGWPEAATTAAEGLIFRNAEADEAVPEDEMAAARIWFEVSEAVTEAADDDGVDISE